MSSVALNMLALFMVAPALANPTNQPDASPFLRDIGMAIGRMDYCGVGGQPVFDAYARGLEQFNLQPTETQALLALAQSEREKSRAEASRKFAGGPCPADAREKIS